MSQTDSAIAPPHRKGDKSKGGQTPPAQGTGPGRAPRPKGPGAFSQYKPEQGRTTRVGTLVGAGAMIAWGALFIRGRLTGYEDVQAWWGLLVTPGIPILFAVVMGALTWWITFANRGAGDFMIATEGEMKKVNWSSKREIIGSTKVVILFTVLLALFLFVVDVVFQTLFSWIGVLKT